MKRIQEDVDRWIKKGGGYWDEFKILGRLMEELGEVARALRGGEKSKTKEEVGDLFFTLIAFSNKFGIDLEETLYNVMEKYTERNSSKSIEGKYK